MSTTSRIRRGVATVGASALTFGAFAAAAPAAFADTTPNATQITVSPSTQSGPADNATCLLYTVTATAGAAPAVGTIDVVLHDTETTPDGSESFCTAGGAQTGTSFTTGSGTAPNVGQTFTTNANGQFTFGVKDSEVETVNILAFDDEPGGTTHTPDANEAQTSSSTPPTAVFTSVQAGTGNNAVGSLTVTPSNVNARPGDKAVYLVTAKTAGATPAAVNQASVNWIITSGPDATSIPQSCVSNENPSGQTNAGNNNPYNAGAPATAAGQVYCLVPTAAAGTDNIKFYVNQTTVANPTTGPDTGEPQATATLTDLGAAPAGDTINVFCSTNGTNSADPVAGQNLKACHDFTTDANGNPPGAPGAQDVFSATISDPSANTSVIQGGSANPNAGGAITPKTVTVNWSKSGGSASSTLVGSTTATTSSCDPTTNQTASGGTNSNAGNACTAMLTEPAPTSGETVTVTGTIAGSNPAASSSATKSFQTRPLGSRNITLTPATQNGTSGTGRTVTAKVVDVNGTPVPNVNVTFSTSGVGHFTSNGIFGTNQQYTTQTGPDGTVQAQVATNGGETGTETISATITQNNSQCTDQAGFVNGTPNPNAKAGNCSATATVKWSQTTPPPSTKRQAVNVKLACFSHHKHRVTCVAQLSKDISGVTVIFWDNHGNKVGSDITNKYGHARVHLRGLKSGVKHRYQAHAKRSSKTRSAWSRFATVFVK